MNFEELIKIKNKHIKEIALRVDTKVKPKYKKEVITCFETGCLIIGSDNIYKEFCDLVKKEGKQDEIKITQGGCFGFCSEGPIVVVYPEGAFYVRVNKDDVNKIFYEHLLNDKIVTEKLFTNVDGVKAKTKEQINFFKKQQFIALKNLEIIDAQNIDDYIAFDGYQSLYKVLTNYNSQQVIDIIKESGLRGRGGAGFPTGNKWQFCYDNKAQTKYVVCNADEGDPGAFMDRSILEGNPQLILEAMAIAGYAIESSCGIIYVRAEYPLATKRLEIAINQARKYGLLGKNIFGTSFDFDIEIRLGAGAYVCGEETALIKSVEGKRGEPRLRPPYPASQGVNNFPTIVNNVETFACVPYIITNGAKTFANVGTQTSKGTKVFALTGSVKNTGLVEMPMGSTVRDVVFNIGGGLTDNQKFKAVQMGGPSGGCIPEQYLDVNVDYESLKSIDNMMGSGGMIVLGDNTCMVDIAKFFLTFTCDESCGKCTPCRIGNTRIREILQKICDGSGEMKDIDDLEELCNYVKNNSLCGLGQNSPNPVLSTLKYFKDEYIEHIVDKKCRAGVCKQLLKYSILKSKCTECGVCSRICPVNAISKVNEKYIIDKNKCIKCGKCMDICRFKAINKE